MRVTKVVREYIEKQVRLKIEPKYAAVKSQAAYEVEARDTVLQQAREAAAEAFDKALTDGIANFPFLEKEQDGAIPQLRFYGSPGLSIKGSNVEGSIHLWERSMRAEIQEKVDDIIVNLELGGSKADLDRMLAEL